MRTRSYFFNLRTTEGFTIGSSRKIDDTQINPKCLRAIVGRWFWHIKGHCKEKHTVAIEQIGLPLDVVQAGLLIATHAERDEDTPMHRQQRNGIHAFEAHHPLIKGDCSLRAKRGFDALVAFVDLSDLANSANSHLSGQA